MFESNQICCSADLASVLQYSCSDADSSPDLRLRLGLKSVGLGLNIQELGLRLCCSVLKTLRQLLNKSINLQSSIIKSIHVFSPLQQKVKIENPSTKTKVCQTTSVLVQIYNYLRNIFCVILIVFHVCFCFKKIFKTFTSKHHLGLGLELEIFGTRLFGTKARLKTLQMDLDSDV